jgi:hypothetical protein
MLNLAIVAQAASAARAGPTTRLPENSRPVVFETIVTNGCSATTHLGMATSTERHLQAVNLKVYLPE